MKKKKKKSKKEKKTHDAAPTSGPDVPIIGNQTKVPPINTSVVRYPIYHMYCIVQNFLRGNLFTNYTQRN